MGVEPRHEQINGGQVLDNFLAATISAALTVNQQCVECVTGASVDVTITLPNVGEAMGRTFAISLITDGGFDVVVQDQDESRDWEGDYTLTAADDYVLLYSDGRKWWQLLDETT